MAYSGPRLLIGRVKEILAEELFQRELDDLACVVRVASVASGRWAFVSDNAEAILGIPAAQMVGGNLFDFVPSEDVAKIRELMNDTGQGSYISWYRTKVGGRQYKWVRTASVGVGDLVVGCVRLEKDSTQWYIHSEPRTE